MSLFSLPYLLCEIRKTAKNAGSRAGQSGFCGFVVLRSLFVKQVGNPTSTTSQLKTRDSKDSARA
jgi:hypothetical protein